MCLRSIDKVMPLEVDRILFSHFGLQDGAQIDGFFQQSLCWFKKAMDAVTGAYTAGKRDGELIKVLSDMFYSDDAARYQPRKAFELNATYMIPVLIREGLGVTDFDMSHDV